MDKNSDTKHLDLLLVFMKNPMHGQVKTRLAQTIGDTNALWVYEQLLQHTCQVITPLTCVKWVFYSDFVPLTPDNIGQIAHQQHVQVGGNLGERMENAFALAFKQGFQRVAIIGTDCWQLNTAILQTSFEQLHQCEVAIGKATDGGYYLLGMRALHSGFFRNKKWSTSSVFADTIADILQAQLVYTELPTLSDVDEFADMPLLWQQQFAF